MKIVIDIAENTYHRFINGFANEYDSVLIEQLFKNGKALEERPQGEWITIEAGEDSLEDHYWYLIAHKDYGTPMKAKYHSDCPHFTFFDANGERATYLFENKITHYMELPDIPIGGKE